MRDSSTIMRERQNAVRRELDRRQCALKVISLDSGIPYSTLLSYFPAPEGGKEPAELPSGALYRLCGHLPCDLLNLLMPEGFAIVRVPTGVDYDSVSSLCREFIDIKDKAHHPESEAGRDLGPTEQGTLTGCVVQLRAA
jgi:hypothetical protein